MQKIDLENKVVLITGVAGFIGANLAVRLLSSFRGIHIVGIDNMNDYYDVSLKEHRLAQIRDVAFSQIGREAQLDVDMEMCLETDSGFSGKFDRFQFVKADISDKTVVSVLFQIYRPDIVVNLAAQAGVRYSITNPDAYISSNLVGFYNILEACRHSYDGGARGVEHLVYASSSSVYGSNAEVPYSIGDKVDSPVSLYAATKKSDELMAHAYAKLYNIPSTGLRFFTVYGPAGRPDMAYFGFTDKLRRGEKIRIFNYGDCKRDFTYIDDIVEGVVRVMQGAPERRVGEDALPLPPYSVYNIGNSQPENLLNFVDILQQELVHAGVLPKDFDFGAHHELVGMQPGDVAVTYADTSALFKDFGFRPLTDLRVGLRVFAEWYKEYYGY
ncbi:MAG: NAD-dependent epimerase/dehydratase family protein [Lachnospiraceae bacterium]|jgi:nucleoside-diphosphate-sugar epimerase|nr:NAD-dependent epimerase/dehydratase family protein [Lachnospiraceae bacterium]